MSTALLLCTGIGLYAQNEVDALRYSLIRQQGSARFNALGGAFTALGGDISAAALNPAGLGLFRRSEVSISPGLRIQGGNVGFQGKSFDLSQSDPVVTSAGLVWAGEGTGKWKAFNFGITYNRMKSFNTGFKSTGEVDLQESQAQQFASDGAGISLSDLAQYRNYSSVLAYDGYVINRDENSEGNFYRPSGSFDGQFNQANSYKTRGRIGETTVSLSSNYDDRLYLGLALGFESVDFESQTSVQEFGDPEGFDPQIDTVVENYTYNYRLKTEGSGVNIKFGAIYRLNDRLRIGGAVHSPTWYSLNDSYRASLDSELNIDDSREPKSQPGAYEYRLNSPWRFTGGVAYVFGKNGLFSIDYEYADYTTAQLKTTKANSSNDGTFDVANTNTNAIYTGTHSIKAGGEYRFNRFMIRIGGAYRTSPFDEAQVQNASDYDTVTLSGGLGYRTSAFYVSLSYSQTAQTSDYFFYNTAPSHRLDSRESLATLSVGYRFGD